MAGVSEIADRFRRLSGDFSARVAAVPVGAWENPSPCEGWTARDVVAHMVSNAGWFFGLIGAPAPAGPSVADDPRGAWDAARDALQRALDDPTTARSEYDSQAMGGRGTFEEAVDRFGNFDVLVHTWDLARAAGLDERLDPAEVRRAFEAALAMDEMLRSGGVCGPKIDVAPDADDQTRFLGFVGRRA